MKIKKNLFAGLFICCLAGLSPAQAAIVELNLDLEISDFVLSSGFGDVPFDPVFLSFSVSFDDASDISDSTAGLTASASIPNAAAIAYSYIASSGGFVIGVKNDSSGRAGLFGEAGTILGSVNDWGLLISNVSTQPSLTLFLYSIENANAIWRSDTFAQVTSEVPEPGVLALFGAGLMGMGFARRRRS